MPNIFNYKQWGERIFEATEPVPSFSQNPNGNSAITRELNDIMAGKKVARIAGNNKFYTFPTRTEDGLRATPLPGDVATYNEKSAIFYVDNNDNEYIVVGNIGTLDKTGKSIENVQPQAFKVSMRHASGDGYGSPVRFKIAPFEAVNVPYTIAKLLKESVRTNDQKTSDGLTDTSKKFIDNMIATFKLVGMAGNISGINYIIHRQLIRM